VRQQGCKICRKGQYLSYSLARKCGAKSVGKDNMCRKGQYVSERAKCVGKDNICRTVWRVNVGQNLSERTICVGKGKMCRKKKIKKSLTVSLKGILWILFRHIV